jgi:hypothetical protein
MCPWSKEIVKVSFFQLLAERAASPLPPRFLKTIIMALMGEIIWIPAPDGRAIIPFCKDSSELEYAAKAPIEAGCFPNAFVTEDEMWFMHDRWYAEAAPEVIWAHVNGEEIPDHQPCEVIQ